MLHPIPVAPSSLVNFATLDAGATNPVRVKFSAGFNTGVRSIRFNRLPLEGISRAERSLPFLAGYDAGRLHARDVTTSEEVTAKLAEAWGVYVSTHTGTDKAHRDLGALPVQQRL